MQKKNKKEFGVYTGFVIAVLVMRLWNIPDLDAPFLFGDEAGYWSHAANLAGLSWTEVESLWYSYGYSLLLVPLFWITHNMSFLYRMAVLMNAFMGVFSLALGKRIIQEVDENCGNITALWISFTAVSYSAYVFQSNIAWSETFLYTWFLVVILGMLKCCKDPAWIHIIPVSMEAAFLYLIHNRCIVILVAYMLTMIYMTKKKLIDYKKLTVVVLILAGVLAVNMLVKMYVSELMWNVVDGFSGNDMGSQAGKMKQFFSLAGWKALLKSFAGKVWYIFSSTLMLAYLGGAYIVKKVICIGRQRERTSDQRISFYIFLFFSVCGVIALTTIAMTAENISYAGRTRLDIFFYGRYSDGISGILIMLGLLDIRSAVKGKNILEFVIGTVMYVSCSGVLYWQTRRIDLFFINTPCAPGIYFFEEFSVIKIMFLVLGVYFMMNIICILTCAQESKEKPKIVRAGCIGILSIVIFLCVSTRTYECYTQVHQKAHYSSSYMCKILNANTKYTIYNLVQENSCRQGIRTRVVESEIKYELPSELEDNCFLIVEGEKIDRINGFAKELYFITANENICLLGTGDELAENLKKEGHICEKLDKTGYKPLAMHDIKLGFKNKVDYIEIAQKENMLIDVTVQSGKSETIMYNHAKYKLSYHIYDDSGALICQDGKRYEIDSFVNKSVIPVTINAEEFGGTGDYILEFDVVEEGKAWLSGLGGRTIRLQVKVIDDSIRFLYNMAEGNFVKEGFHPVENAQFAWTSSEKPQVRCYLDVCDYYVQLQQSVGIPFGELKMDSYPIEVYINEEYLATLRIDASNNGENLEFWITKEKINQGANIIAFQSDLWSPADYGADDKRKLGFAVSKMIFEKRRKEQ